MRQLNVALNRDIFRVKRIAFYTDPVLAKPIQEAMEEYPRTEIFQDVKEPFFNYYRKTQVLIWRNLTQFLLYPTFSIHLVEPNDKNKLSISSIITISYFFICKRKAFNSFM